MVSFLFYFNLKIVRFFCRNLYMFYHFPLVTINVNMSDRRLLQ